MPRIKRTSVTFWILLCLLLYPVATIHAQFPTSELHSVFPFGGQTGNSVDVKVEGVFLEDISALVFSNPGIKAVKKARQQFSVSIASDVQPGMYDVRALGSSGLSNPRLFVVGQLKEFLSNVKNNSRDTAQAVTLECLMNGFCKPELSDFYKVQLQKGKRVLIECCAHRADAKLDGVLILTDANGKQLAHSNDVLRRDPLIDFTPTADGEYIIEIYDFLYHGGDVFGYRLKFSTIPRIDFIFPPSGVPGTKSKYKIFGRNLNGKLTDVKSLDGKMLEELELEIELPAKPTISSVVHDTLLEIREGGQNYGMYHIELPNGRSNEVPIYFAKLPVIMEQEPNDPSATPQELSLPCEVVGQFNPKGDQDTYSFQAEKDEEWWIEVNSARMGQNTDPFLLVQQVTKKPDGSEKLVDISNIDDTKYFTVEERQSASFDLANNDAEYKFVAPQSGTFRVTVRDMSYQTRGNAQHVYRLAIRKPSPDFQLMALTDFPQNPNNGNTMALWSPQLQSGGSIAMRIYAQRQDNFKNDITVKVEGLPDSITCPPIILSSGMKTGALVFRADKHAAPWNGPIRVIGTSQVGDREVIRFAEAGVMIWGTINRTETPTRSRWASELMLSVSDLDKPPAAIDIVAESGHVFETCIGGKLEIPVKVTRRNNLKEPIRFFESVLPRSINLSTNDAFGVKEDPSHVTMNVRGNTQPGTYTLVLHAATRLNNYRRNAEAAEIAEKKKQELEKLLKEVNDQYRLAERAKGNAENHLTTAITIVKQAKQEQDRAIQSVKGATKKKTADAELVAAANKALADEPDNADLAAAQHTAEKNLSSSETSLKTADEKQKTIQYDFDELTAKQILAQKIYNAKLEVFDTIAASKAFIETAHLSATEEARQKTQYAQPKTFNLTFYSLPAKLIIHPAPFTMQSDRSELEIKAGEKIELRVTIKRLFEMTNPITVQVIQNNGRDVQAKELTITNNVEEGKIQIEVTKQARTGGYPIVLRGRSNYNGQTTQVDVKLHLKVIPKEDSQ